MAEEVPRQVFYVKDLTTKCVTLYPSRAQVVREIQDIELGPGLNEIEIIGLTPSTDEHSVQIDGRGAATITDITVELVPNRDDDLELFSDDDDDDSESAEDELSLPYEDSDDEVEAVKSIASEIKKLERTKAEASNREASGTRQLEALDRYFKSVQAERIPASEMAKMLELYDQKHKEISEMHSVATEEIKQLEKQITRKTHEKLLAGREESKRKLKQKQAHEKLLAKKNHKRMEQLNEKKRLKEERLKYWPKKVYRVLLQLETMSADTPASSRRNSIDTIAIAPPNGPKGKLDDQPFASDQLISSNKRTVTLVLSYVTTEAFWSPRYEISISSLRKTAIITYRAEFGNRTSETWTDAKFILSTSQTSYAGLDDKPPTMLPWNVRLGRFEDVGKGGLLSFGETNRSDGHKKRKDDKEIQSNLFGHPNARLGISSTQQQPPGSSRSRSLATAAFGGGAAETSRQQLSQQQQVFQPENQVQLPAPQMQMQQMQIAQRGEAMVHMWQPTMDNNLLEGSNRGVGNQSNDEDQLDFEESTWEDCGLTATYELPGTRTIAPASLNRRHKIVSITAANIQLSYIAIPKLRAAAFLRAKIRNPSTSVTLLKGMAGVTLDGSFLGNISLPRVSPAQLFTLSLGTDPAIHVSYPKPTVHRSTTGLFSKESAQAFSRSIWLTNTRSTPVELLVLDQIPKSQDERLKIDITQPKGLNKEGDSVRTGQNAREGQQATAWGKAVAALKKNGEVAWTVNLEKGQACLLKLDYEARLPSQETIVNA